MSKGRVNTKKWYSTDLIDNPTETSSIPISDMINKLSSIQGENNELFEKISEKLKVFDKKVLNLRLEGFSQREIQKKLETHHVAVNSSIKRIREIMNTNSPFNGSKLKIVKRVKRKEFEANKSEYMKIYGKQGDHDFNESFEQFPSKDDPSIGLLVKELNSD